MFGDYSNTSSFNSDGAWRKLYRAVNPTANLAANTRLYVSASEGSWLTCKLINGMNGYVLKENATYASLDEDLWVLLQSKEWRTRLRDYIVEHKLTDGHWLRHLSEGLASLAAILLVA